MRHINAQSASISQDTKTLSKIKGTCKESNARKMPLHYKKKCHTCYTVHNYINTETTLSNKLAMVKTVQTNIAT